MEEFKKFSDEDFRSLDVEFASISSIDVVGRMLLHYAKQINEGQDYIVVTFNSSKLVSEFVDSFIGVDNVKVCKVHNKLSVGGVNVYLQRVKDIDDAYKFAGIVSPLVIFVHSGTLDMESFSYLCSRARSRSGTVRPKVVKCEYVKRA